MKKYLSFFVAIVTSLISSAYSQDLNDVRYGVTSGVIRNMGDNFRRQVEKSRNNPTYEETDQYSNLTLRMGTSDDFGEYLQLRAYLGDDLGYTLFGGIGQNLYGSETYPHSKLWHLGVGYYGLVYDDISYSEACFDIYIANSPNFDSNIIGADIGLSYFFPHKKLNRFGVYGGFGLAMCPDMPIDDDYDFLSVNWHLGIAIKLWK